MVFEVFLPFFGLSDFFSVCYLALLFLCCIASSEKLSLASVLTGENCSVELYFFSSRYTSEQSEMQDSVFTEMPLFKNHCGHLFSI